MGELQKNVVDDDNDTLLFKRLEEHVLENFPNPDRIGCFDHDTLVKFVETPGKLDLEDPKYMHVFQCAECTRELMELRRLREERLAGAAHSKVRQTAWRLTWAAAALALAAVVGFVALRYRDNRQVQTATEQQLVPVFVDLSSKGVARDTDSSQAAPLTTLPTSRIRAHLILPFYSPGGRYSVTVSRDRSQAQLKASGSATASVNGSHTELTVDLDLTHVSPGMYFLGTTRDDDGGPYYYPITVRQSTKD